MNIARIMTGSALVAVLAGAGATLAGPATVVLADPSINYNTAGQIGGNGPVPVTFGDQGSAGMGGVTNCTVVDGTQICE